jgi:hypothetical protein
MNDSVLPLMGFVVSLGARGSPKPSRSPFQAGFWKVLQERAWPRETQFGKVNVVAKEELRVGTSESLVS